MIIFGQITGTGTNIGGIVGFRSEKTVVENTINGGNGIINDEESPKEEKELKSIYNLLGNNFLQDKNNINNGYPILKWQVNTSL